MIESVTLKNFQSHQKTILELSPYLTVLVGRSNSGKSSVVRALYKLTRNRPRGTFFVRNGKKSLVVEVVTDKGLLSRIFGKNKNVYYVNKTRFAKTGDTFPEEAKALGVVGDVINVGGRQFDLNFQRQQQQLFLVDSTPSEKAALFDEISGASRVNRVLQFVAKDSRIVKKDIVKLREEVSQRKVKVSELEEKAEIAKKVVRIYQELEWRGAVEDKINELLSLSEPIQDLEELSSLYRKLLVEEKKRQGIEELLMTYRTFRDLVESLDEKKGEQRTLEERFKKIQLKLGYCPTCKRRF